MQIINDLTKHFGKHEFFISEQHPELAKKAMEERPGYIDYRLFILCHFIMQPIRLFADGPVFITSGYRDKALNDATLGSSPTSLHMEGLAADFVTKDRKLLYYIFEYIKSYLRNKYGEAFLYVHKNGVPRNIHVALLKHGKEPIAEKIII